MSAKGILLFISLLSYIFIGRAQTLVYDPLLDTTVRILNGHSLSSSGEYVWYPGQLSAHLQKKRVKESAERCVNVGYPGRFYEPEFRTFFQKEVNIPSATTMDWKSTGETTIALNGNIESSPAGKILLPKGKSTILFEIHTKDNLPALSVVMNGEFLIDGWKSSLDGKFWNTGETSNVFGTNGKAPLDDPEIDVAMKPITVLPVRNAFVNNEKIVVKKNGFVLLDFFHLEVGKVSFRAKGKGRLKAFVGESPEETLNENINTFEQKPIEDFTISNQNKEIVLPERALRYVKILCDEECEISIPQFIAKVWPVDFLMKFETSDDRINNIFNASVASLHTSTHGFYLDGIKRDYLPWSMDAVLSTFAGDYTFGDKQVSRNSLSVALMPLLPQKSDLGIPDYPLHALVGFNQYYKRYGDFGTILSYRDRIEQLLAFYETIQDERGFISANVGVSWGFVPGWATRRGPDKKGTPTYAQIMLYHNYMIGANFAEKWGDKKAAKHFLSRAEALKENILIHFWDTDRSLFINGYTQKGELDSTISHHAQYWAILAGIFPEEHYDNLFNVLPNIPYYRDYVSFEKGYEFLAYSKVRKVKEMWDFLDAVFGDWLDQGHSRFPENFSYKKTKDEQLVFYSRPFGLSLCHGANGVPAVVAALYGIVGFSQSDTQLNHYIIRPDLMDLAWANIEFPVKEGIIGVRLSKDGENQIVIPDGCKVDYFGNDNNKTTFTKSGIYRIP